MSILSLPRPPARRDGAAERSPAPPTRPPLRLVEPDAPRIARPRLGLVGTVLLGAVFAALFALAAMHTLVVQAQFRLDRLEQQVAERVERVEALRVDVARAESPEAIVAAAEALGMVRPPERIYLLPVTDGGPSAAPTAPIPSETGAP